MEILTHVLRLDFGWIIDTAIQNLLMILMLLAVFYIFLEGKNFLYASLIIFITLFAFLDFESVLGIEIFVGKFLLIYYVTKLAVLAIAESNEFLKKRLIFVNELQFFGAFVILQLFL